MSLIPSMYPRQSLYPTGYLHTSTAETFTDPQDSTVDSYGPVAYIPCLGGQVNDQRLNY